ncbi:hypothetical protein [Streptomyces sp. KL116D]|uniref:hypothetical protein n=1 Tax=Streptomyces sp. KL116D TaxID=3045152 RepID=UPI003557A944
MSTPATGAVQRARLMAAGLRVRDLPGLRDVDYGGGSRRRSPPPRRTGSRFAAELARCRAVGRR